jgi:hypothetical protein
MSRETQEANGALRKPIKERCLIEVLAIYGSFIALQLLLLQSQLNVNLGEKNSIKRGRKSM